MARPATTPLHLFPRPRGLWLASMLLAAILVACSAGPPSESMGKNALDHQIQTQSGGKIRLVSFHKTNGIGDEKVYAVEYEAEIEFLSDGAWSRNDNMDPSNPSFGFAAQQLPSNSLGQVLGFAVGATNVRQGQHATFKGTVRFEKTEKGWRGRDGEIYSNGQKPTVLVPQPQEQATGLAGIERKLLGRWNNPAPGEGESLAYPVNWQYVEFQPNSKVVMSWIDSEETRNAEYDLLGEGQMRVKSNWSNVQRDLVYELTDDTLTLIYTYGEYGQSKEMKTTLKRGGASSIPKTSEDEERAIVSNLRRLSRAALHDHDLETDEKTYAKLVGPDKPIKSLRSIAGEDYTSLKIKSIEAITVKTADGREVTLEAYPPLHVRISDGREFTFKWSVRAADGHEYTRDGSLLVPLDGAYGVRILRAIRKNLNDLKFTAMNYCIAEGVKQTTYGKLIGWSLFGDDSGLKALSPVAGEDYTAMTFELSPTASSVPLLVRAADGRQYSIPP